MIQATTSPPTTERPRVHSISLEEAFTGVDNGHLAKQGMVEPEVDKDNDDDENDDDLTLTLLTLS